RAPAHERGRRRWAGDGRPRGLRQCREVDGRAAAGGSGGLGAVACARSGDRLPGTADPAAGPCSTAGGAAAHPAPVGHRRYDAVPSDPGAAFMHTVQSLNAFGCGHLPDHLGIVITAVNGTEIRSSLAVRKELMAPNGFLHAGSVVTLADTSCGYGCVS